MPTLDFKGKQFIYGHHLTVPIRTLVPDGDKSLHTDYPPPTYLLILLPILLIVCLMII